MDIPGVGRIGGVTGRVGGRIATQAPFCSTNGAVQFTGVTGSKTGGTGRTGTGGTTGAMGCGDTTCATT